jgi:predicted adenylyl cyclase CyaB
MLGRLGRISGPRRNIELKARDSDPVRSLAVCASLGAEGRGRLLQRDTYFVVPSGRLKLREESDAVPHLISYLRPDESGQRESRYRIVEVEQGEELIEALGSNLGVKVVVEKERRLFLWQGVRIHLDRVTALGNFIEFEAVAAAGSDLSREREKVETLRGKFELTDADLVAGSYCDLVLASR